MTHTPDQPGSEAVLRQMRDDKRDALEFRPDGDPRWRATKEAQIAALDAAIAALTRPGEAGAGGDKVSVAQATAPERIWLAVSDDTFDAEQPFPGSGDWEHVCWSVDAPIEVCVPYVRADLSALQAGSAPGEAFTLDEIEEAWRMSLPIHQGLDQFRVALGMLHDTPPSGSVASGRCRDCNASPCECPSGLKGAVASGAGDAFERAMKASWEMVNPRETAAPGSYYLGHNNGLIAALRTVRDNYERELKRSRPAAMSAAAGEGGAGVAEVIGWHRAQIGLGDPQFRNVHERLIGLLLGEVEPCAPL